MQEKTNLASSAEFHPPISSCVCLHLRKASRAITQYFDGALQPSGLLATQFIVLAAVSRKKTGTISELARGLVMERTTLTRNLKPLERNGWVKIEPGQDKRTRIARITSSGELVLQKALPLQQQAQDDVMNFLGESHLNALLLQLAEVSKLHHSN